MTITATHSSGQVYPIVSVSYPVAANHMAGEHNEVLLRASPQAPAGYYELLGNWQGREIGTFTTSTSVDCVIPPGSGISRSDKSAFERTLTVVAE